MWTVAGPATGLQSDPLAKRSKPGCRPKSTTFVTVSDKTQNYCTTRNTRVWHGGVFAGRAGGSCAWQWRRRPRDCRPAGAGRSFRCTVSRGRCSAGRARTEAIDRMGRTTIRSIMRVTPDDRFSGCLGGSAGPLRGRLEDLPAGEGAPGRHARTCAGDDFRRLQQSLPVKATTNDRTVPCPRPLTAVSGDPAVTTPT